LIKILHIIRYPQIGGAEILVKNIINSNSNDHFAHYMFYKKQGALLHQIAVEKRRYLIQSNFKNPILFILNLRRILKSYNIHIVHTHQPVDVLYALFAAIGLNVKIIRTYHGFSGLKRKGSCPLLKQKLLNFVINKFVCLNFYVSDTLLQHFRILNPGQQHRKQRVLYNGIDIEGLKKKKNTNIRNVLNLTGQGILLGMIGSFNTSGRDQFTICEALKFVLEIYPEVHFIFIGRTKGKMSELFEKCYRFCGDNRLLARIHFLGERSDISDLLNSLDLYVHSSSYETFGLALVEAMACSIPCISSDISAFREVSDDGKNVTLFEKGNAGDLVRKMVLEIGNIKSVETKSRVTRAKNFVEKRFSIQTHIENLHSYYLECLK